MNLNHIIREEINGLINEGLSKTLYHFTYINNLISILKTNQFATSSNLGGTADSSIDRGRFFFFSTQRSKGMSGYGKNHGDVCIVLDGEKLNQNFKGFATDYWNWSKNPKDYDNPVNYRNALLSSELEDRIVTNKPYIDNAKKYILEIHISTNNNHYKITKSQLDNILSNNDNIPTFFYNTEKDFKLLNKNNAIDINDIIFDEERHDDFDDDRKKRDIIYAFTEITPFLILDDDKNKNIVYSLLDDFIKETHDETIKDNINKQIEKRLYDLKNRSYYADDYYMTLKTYIHNNRGKPNKYFRELLKLLVNDIKKHNVSTLESYVEKKLNQTIK